MEVENISKEEYVAWMDNKVTRAVLGILKEKKEGWTEQLAEGKTLNKDSLYSTDYVVGLIRGISEAMDIQYED